MKKVFTKAILATLILISVTAFCAPAFAQNVNVSSGNGVTNVNGNIPLPGLGNFSFNITIVNVTITVHFTIVPGNATASGGTYSVPMAITQSVPLSSSASVAFDTFTTYPASFVSSTPVTLAANNLVTNVTVANLTTGYYKGALYNGSTQVSPTVYFSTYGNSSVGGLSVVFPPNQQSISATSATLLGQVSVQTTMPVNLSYIWGPSGVPLSATNETPLITLASLQPGATQSVTLHFSNLVAGTTYQFALENKISGGTSAPLQFTTPTGTATVTSIGSGATSYQPPPPVVDTISGTGIVPRCGRTQDAANDIPQNQLVMCNFNDFLTLVGNILKYALILVGPIVAIIAMYAGFMIIWLGKIPDKNSAQMTALKKYKTLLVRVAIGLLIILSAWIIVSTILNQLGVQANYILLSTS